MRGGLALGLAAIVVVAAAAGAVAALPGLRAAILAKLPRPWQLQLGAWRHGVRVDHGLVIPMPDGARLAASLYLPRSAEGRRAAVLIRVPYGRKSYTEAFGYATFFASHGYAAIVQDLRGTGDSGGRLLPWAQAESDGVATLDWISAQPWSDGRVGTFGCSALGETQYVLARANHPAHRAMIALGAGGAIGSAAGRYAPFGVFEGGVLQLASAFGWFAFNGAMDRDAPPPAPFDIRRHLATLPVSTLVERVRPGPNGFREFVATPLADRRWSEWGYLTDGDRPRVPALVVNTWGDQTVGETLAYAEQVRTTDPAMTGRQKVFIAPGPHCDHDVIGTKDRFGDLAIANATKPWNEIYLAWFDHWLRGGGDGLASTPAYTVFQYGEDRWLESGAWPPEVSHPVRWHLASGGHANSRDGDGRLTREPPIAAATDTYAYDPSDPVPSRGGPVCCTGGDDVPGPVDQSDVESRRDVLVYTSAPLGEALRIAGPVRARLAFSSSAPDTDLVLRLAHVRADGRSIGLQEGALRLRYRDGFARPALMEAERIYEAKVDLRAIAVTIPKGDRLRLHVTSSSFPRLERNLNTGAPNNADETRMAVATNCVHTGAGRASWLELSVLPPPP